MPVVELAQGKFRGTTKDGVDIFHALPYSQPFQRFQSPVAVQNSDSDQPEKPANQVGAISPQRPSRLEVVMGPMPSGAGPQREDTCGVLSVYAPGTRTTTSQLPVIVWTHGGAWVSGGSQIPWYDGSRLARDGQVVVVTVNYRLGALGFLFEEGRSLSGLRLPCGNEDVILAFEWVQNNISAFGGDPNNVTAFGQSAGGFQTQTLLENRPDLFHRAIIQSDPADSVNTKENCLKIRSSFDNSLPANVSAAEASIEDILNAEEKAIVANPDIPFAFFPCRSDGLVLSEQKFEKSGPPKDILVGWTKDDGSGFAHLADETSYDSDHVLTNSIFKDPALLLADRLRSAGHNVTSFELGWRPEGSKLGATHCCDLPLFFGDYEAWKNAPMLGTAPWSEWDRRGQLLRVAWAKFAKDGTKPLSQDGLNVY